MGTQPQNLFDFEEPATTYKMGKLRLIELVSDVTDSARMYPHRLRLLDKVIGLDTEFWINASPQHRLSSGEAVQPCRRSTSDTLATLGLAAHPADCVRIQSRSDARLYYLLL